MDTVRKICHLDPENQPWLFSLKLLVAASVLGLLLISCLYDIAGMRFFDGWSAKSIYSLVVPMFLLAGIIDAALMFSAMLGIGQGVKLMLQQHLDPETAD